MAKSNLAYKETEFEFVAMPEFERNSNLRIRAVKTTAKENNVKTVKRTKSRAKLHKKTNLALFLLAIVAFMVLSRGVMITEKIDRIEEKRDALNQMIASNQKTQIEIDSALNLKNVEEIATHDFKCLRSDCITSTEDYLPPLFYETENGEYICKYCGQKYEAK